MTSSDRIRRWCLAAVLVLAGVGVSLWLRTPGPTPAPIAEVEDESDVVAPAANPGFVGIAVCSECHAKRAEEFRASRHVHASRPTSDIASPGFAPGRGTHPTRDPNVRFEMSRTPDDWIATGIRQSAAGEERIEYRIGLVYGAGGTRDEMYFAWQGDRLVQLPIAWLHPQNRWGNVVDRIEAREVMPNCLECHTTWAAHVPGTLNEFRRDDLMLGVTCERCHGTGREHAEHHRAHPNEPSQAIIHPGKLDRQRSMDLCAQCHTNVKRKGPAYSYRPGEPLESHFRVVHPRFAEDNIVGNQVASLQASKCYQKSEMTCTTCHDPHGASKPTNVQAACLTCHAPASCKEQPRLPAAVRNDCTACHLPPRVWMNVHFHTTDDQYVPVAARTDHRIGIHPMATKERMLAWLRTQTDAKSRADGDRLTAEIGAAWLKDADRLHQAGRFKAEIGAVREAMKCNPDDATKRRLKDAIASEDAFESLKKGVDPRQPDRAILDLKKLLELRPGYAWAHSQLGSTYARLGNHREAVANLEAVAVNDPDDASGLILLAWMEYIDGRPEQSIALSAKADAIEPANAKIHYQWGRALEKLRRWDEAKVHFARTLAIQPNHPDANRRWSEVLRREGNELEAARFERKALRLANGREFDR